jgi:hypothetical protein
VNSAEQSAAGPAGDEHGDELEPVAFAPTEFEARTKAAVLEDEGIRAFVFGAERAWTGGLGLRPAKPGVPVLVRRRDLDRAGTILESRLADAELDWNQVDVGEPEPDAVSPRPGFITLMRHLGRVGAIIIVILVALSLAMSLLSLVLTTFA